MPPLPHLLLRVAGGARATTRIGGCAFQSRAFALERIVTPAQLRQQRRMEVGTFDSTGRILLEYAPTTTTTISGTNTLDQRTTDPVAALEAAGGVVGIVAHGSTDTARTAGLQLPPQSTGVYRARAKLTDRVVEVAGVSIAHAEAAAAALVLVEPASGILDPASAATTGTAIKSWVFDLDDTLVRTCVLALSMGGGGGGGVCNQRTSRG
jgi:hypothetical protein